jgi:hypothetical protein
LGHQISAFLASEFLTIAQAPSKEDEQFSRASFLLDHSNAFD